MKNKHPFCGKYMQKSLRCKVFGSLVLSRFSSTGSFHFPFAFAFGPKELGKTLPHRGENRVRELVCVCRPSRAKFKLASSGREWLNCHPTKRETSKRKWLAIQLTAAMALTQQQEHWQKNTTVLKIHLENTIPHLLYNSKCSRIFFVHLIYHLKTKYCMTFFKIVYEIV